MQLIYSIFSSLVVLILGGKNLFRWTQVTEAYGWCAGVAFLKQILMFFAMLSDIMPIIALQSADYSFCVT